MTKPWEFINAAMDGHRDYNSPYDTLCRAAERYQSGENPYVDEAGAKLRDHQVADMWLKQNESGCNDWFEACLDGLREN